MLHGGIGDDVLDGGDGVDTASYSNAAPDGARGEITAGGFGGVTANLGTGGASGSFGADTLIGIENLIGSSGDDVLIGDGRRNSLSGGAGNDLLQGEGGGDILVLGEGSDTAQGGSGADRIVIGLGNASISGGKGFDTIELGDLEGKVVLDFGKLSYSAKLQTPVPVWADTGTAEVRAFSHDGTASQLTPELVREAQAVFANSNDDLMRLLPGADDPQYAEFLVRTIEEKVGYTGDFSSIESVVGGAATTRIFAGAGKDSYDGTASANDILDLGRIKSGVKFDLASGATDNGLLDGDSYLGIEQIVGTQHADRLLADGGDNLLLGDRGDDYLRGRGGHDTLDGGSGDDMLNGGGGNDLLNGRAGMDTAIYSGKQADYAVDQISAGSWRVTSLAGAEGTDILKQVERLSFSDGVLDLP